MNCQACNSEQISSIDIPDVGKHVICYDCGAEWVE